MKKALTYHEQCQFCEHYVESFDEFGHLVAPRCELLGCFTKHSNTCDSFAHSADDYLNNFYTDINDDD